MILIFSPKWGSYVRNGNLENKHSNLWWLLKVKIKHNQENLVKPHCKESYLLSLGSFVFRVFSFLVNLILLLKFSKHETGYLGNNKQQKREAQATSSYTCLPVTRSFAKEKQATSTWIWNSLKALLKVRMDFLSPHYRNAPANRLVWQRPPRVGYERPLAHGDWKKFWRQKAETGNSVVMAKGNLWRVSGKRRG